MTTIVFIRNRYQTIPTLGWVSHSSADIDRLFHISQPQCSGHCPYYREANIIVHALLVHHSNTLTDNRCNLDPCEPKSSFPLPGGEDALINLVQPHIALCIPVFDIQPLHLSVRAEFYSTHLADIQCSAMCIRLWGIKLVETEFITSSKRITLSTHSSAVRAPSDGPTCAFLRADQSLCFRSQSSTSAPEISIVSVMQ